MKTAAAGFVLCLAAAGLAAQEGPPKWIEDFEKKFPPVEKNAAAEELERFSLALGLDPYGGSGDDHPLKEDLEAYGQAGFSGWLEAQLRAADDSISAPPPRLVEFLDKRQAIVSRIVTLLGREVPQWALDVHEAPRRRPELTIVIAVGRILLSASLVEERAGHHAEAANLLEATWSLSRSVAPQPDLTFQLIGVALIKLQAGVLRKMSEPAFEWADRMAGDAPTEGMLEAIQSSPLAARAASRESSSGSASDAWMRGWRAVADGLRTMSACEMSHRPSEEIWKPLLEEIARAKEGGPDTDTGGVEATALPNLTSAFRRVARVMVDRELTAKVLELRFEKAASRPARWPDKFFDAESRVCPGVSYEYRSTGMAMLLKFGGSVGDPGAPLVLPLSFEARAPKPTPSPAPTRKPSPTPTPRPSLTPARARA